MLQPQAMPCPHCGALYQLTPEYVAQYGGQMTGCGRCGNTFPVPASLPSAPPVPAPPTPVLSYSGHAVAIEAAGIWREDRQIIVTKDVVFPPRCVKCNQPADGDPIRRRYYWHHPAIYLIILVNLLIYAIVALVVRESGRVGICLCARHRQIRRNSVLAAWLIVFAGIGLVVLGFGDALAARPVGWGWVAILLGVVLFIAAAVFGSSRARILTPVRIDKRFLWLKGAGPEFLETLPDART